METKEVISNFIDFHCDIYFSNKLYIEKRSVYTLRGYYYVFCKNLDQPLHNLRYGGLDDKYFKDEIWISGYFITDSLISFCQEEIKDIDFYLKKWMEKRIIEQFEFI